jgi:hypothetical protein
MKTLREPEYVKGTYRAIGGDVDRTAQMVNLDDMDVEDFLLVARDRGLATAIELDRFAADWRKAYENGEPGFGDETTIDDWVGGLKCWRLLGDILEFNGLSHDAQIDWSNVKVSVRGSN